MYKQIYHLIVLLKAARRSQKIRQHVLADKIGIPQSHLSKIEQGEVDLRLTSFVEMARALEFEVMLVPRQDSAVIKNLIAAKEQAELSAETSPAYQLDDEEEDEDV